MAEIYARKPDGSVVAIDEADQQAAANAGYTALAPDELAQVQHQQVQQMGQGEAVTRGLVQARPDYDVSQGFSDAVKSALTFGQADSLQTPESRAIGQRFREEHPWLNVAATTLGSVPALAATGGISGALGAAAEGAGAVAEVGAQAAGFALPAAAMGAQIEGEDARLAARDFSWTNAAVSGAAAETLGRSAHWVLSRALGGTRNVLASAAQNAVADDTERAVSKGGWVGDYRVAQHAEDYHNQLATLGADDLDKLESSFNEVSRQDKKRARIQNAVIDNQAVQQPIAIEQSESLQRLRSNLASELEDNPSGPAKRLARQLDDRIAQLDANPRGKNLWRQLDENRQALQEYRQDLHQAYDTTGSAWLSREGLKALDDAASSARDVLLREDAWGEQAAAMQREYNTPFYSQWFPARREVLRDLYFATGKDARGFTEYRGDPQKMLNLLKQPAENADRRRIRELFSQYLDGAQAVAQAGAQDSPGASRDALEAIRRLRRGLAAGEAVTQAAANTERRAGFIDVAGLVGGAAAGAATGGPALGVAMGAAGRTVRLGHWLSRASRSLGLFAGQPIDFAGFLAKDALAPTEADAGRAVSEQLLNDLAESPFPVAPSVRPPPPEPVGTTRIRGVGTTPETPEALPGIGAQEPRRGTVERPAGAYAMEPMPRPISVRGEGIEPTPAPTPAGPGGTLRPGRETLPPGEPSGPSTPPEPGPGGTMRPSISEDETATMPPSAMPSEPGTSYVEPDISNEVAGLKPTHQAPFRTEGMAWDTSVMGPGANARAAEARRLEALTSGEFANVLDSLKAMDARTPEGESMAETLEKAEPELRKSGFISDEPPPESGTRSSDWRSPSAPFDTFNPPATMPPPAVEQARNIVADLGYKVTGDAHVGTSEVFGKVVTPEEWQKLVPLDVLSELGTPAKQQMDFLDEGFDRASKKHVIIASAEGPETEVGPHTIQRADGTVEQDPGGYTAPTWKIMRSYARNADGELEVHHDYFYLRADMQGTGIGARVLKSQFEQYVKMGVKKVEVSCDDVGKYFWPSLGFDATSDRVQAALDAYRGFVVRKGYQTAEEVAAATKLVRSLPSLAQTEYGKEFLLTVNGRWNMGLTLKIDESNPFWHLARQRLGIDGGTSELRKAGGLALAALGGWIDGRPDGQTDKASTAGMSGGAAATGALGLAALFGSRAALMQLARTRLVSDVAKQLFSSMAMPAARVAARSVVAAYTRADLARRQQDFQSWAENPNELVNRVAEGFREAPPEHFPDIAQGIYKTANFLKERLPSATKLNAVSLRDIPISREAAQKYAKYERAALNPRDALREAGQSGHISPELMETLEELYPDMLAELRVNAYQTVREDGPPPTVQARLSYARLFGGDGAFADPAMSETVAQMAALAYNSAPAQKTSPPSAHVSAVSQASSAPFPRQA